MARSIGPHGSSYDGACVLCGVVRAYHRNGAFGHAFRSPIIAHPAPEAGNVGRLVRQGVEVA